MYVTNKKNNKKTTPVISCFNVYDSNGNGFFISIIKLFNQRCVSNEFECINFRLSMITDEIQCKEK